MVSLRVLVRIVALIAAIAWPVPARADFIVVPNSLTAAEGNSAIDAGPDIRIQQVYGASEFGGLGVIQITGLALRPSAPGSAFGPDTVTGLQVHLSTTSRAPDGLSTTFADNVGPDETTVFNGDWTRSSTNSPGPGGTRAFDIILTFTTSFTYDPAQGNLLVDFIDARPPIGSPPLFPLVDAHVVVGDSVSIIVGNANDSTGVPFASVGVVTQFAFQPAAAAVPEPASWILFGLGLAGFLAWRQRVGRKGQGVPEASM